MNQTASGQPAASKDIWTSISSGTRVNDMALGPWEYAGTNDNLIHQYLKKRFLKENTSVIVFQIFCVLTCGLAMIISVMVYDTYSLFWLAAAVAMVTIYFLSFNLYEHRLLREIIRNKEYVLCDCVAYELSGRKQEKKCFLKDLSGTVLMEQTGEQPETPMGVPYYDYFSSKDFSGKLLRVRYGSRGYHYMFFPTHFLEKN